MIDNYLERIENSLNDIRKIQLLFRKKYGEECLADKEIEELLKIAKEEHEEIQQYRAIGTVEECREARGRQMGKKPTPIDYERYIGVVNNAECLRGAYWCPNCKHAIRSGDYCNDCGQAIDWSDAD